MGALLIAAYVLAVVVGIVSLVCFILVLVEMFRREQTGLAIACIVLALCSGIGTLIAFVYGWIKAREWSLQKVMLSWTVCFVVQLVLVGVIVAVGASVAVDANNQFRQQMKQIEQDLPEIKIE